MVNKKQKNGLLGEEEIEMLREALETTAKFAVEAIEETKQAAKEAIETVAHGIMEETTRPPTTRTFPPGTFPRSNRRTHRVICPQCSNDIIRKAAPDSTYVICTECDNTFNPGEGRLR